MSLNFLDNSLDNDLDRDSLSLRDFENLRLKELDSGDFATHSVFFMIFENDLFAHENRMKFLTGFKASMGAVCLEIRSYDADSKKIVTGDKFLFVDDRYFDEASEFIKNEVYERDAQEIEGRKRSKITVLKNEKEWLKKFNEKNGILCLDKNLIRCEKLMHLRSEFSEVQYRCLNRSLLNEKWTNECKLSSRKSESELADGISRENDCLQNVSSYIGNIMSISNEDAGESSESKIERVIRRNLKNSSNSTNKSQAHLIIDSSSIAWLLNKRKVSQNPGLNGVLLISETETVLLNDLKSLRSQLNSGPEKYNRVFVDVKNACISLVDLLADMNIQVAHRVDPCILPKSIKNETEIKNIKEIHRYDGAAVVKFMYWMENVVLQSQIENSRIGVDLKGMDSKEKVCKEKWQIDKDIDKKRIDNFTNSFTTVSEIDAGHKLHEIKSQNDRFLCESFETIMSFDEKSFMIHKKPENDQIKNFYLLDSGGQYAYGTTDMTRTVAVSSDFEDLSEKRYHYTLVLKGHVAIASARFKNGIFGANLDILARQYLWENGLDYLHSTGHGVGYLLNVHEGPQAINFRNNIALKPGMILSNEPGYYLKNEYGIRIENLVRVKESPYEGYLEFETISFAPFCSKLIDRSMLNSKEIDWIKNYYASIFENLNGLLSQNEGSWLKSEMSDFL